MQTQYTQKQIVCKYKNWSIPRYIGYRNFYTQHYFHVKKKHLNGLILIWLLNMYYRNNVHEFMKKINLLLSFYEYLNDLNDLLVKVVLFSDFSIKFAQIVHTLLSKPSIQVVLEYRKRYFDLICSGSELHICGPNDDRLFCHKVLCFLLVVF